MWRYTLYTGVLRCEVYIRINGMPCLGQHSIIYILGLCAKHSFVQLLYCEIGCVKVTSLGLTTCCVVSLLCLVSCVGLSLGGCCASWCVVSGLFSTLFCV